ncbi:hypothetical protein D3C81_654530 [compost metagenome]
MNQEFIDEVVNYLIPIANNLAARISVMYKMIIKDKNLSGFTNFREDQIFGVRKNAKKFKKEIDPKMYSKIQEICDYFEAMYTAYKLSK